jgi:hypothetical protein
MDSIFGNVGRMLILSQDDDDHLYSKRSLNFWRDLAGLRYPVVQTTIEAFYHRVPSKEVRGHRKAFHPGVVDAGVNLDEKIIGTKRDVVNVLGDEAVSRDQPSIRVQEFWRGPRPA